MTFRLMVMNPAFSENKEKAVSLTAAQLEVVHDYVIGALNDGQPIREAKIIIDCAAAGVPIQFGDPS